MQSITIINSHQGVAWNRHLYWLFENMPDTVESMYKKGELFDHLDRFVALITVYRSNYQRQGLTKEEAEFEIVKKALGQTVFEAETCQLLNPSIEESILDDISKMEDNIKTIEV